jgi:hypothetical protein
MQKQKVLIYGYGNTKMIIFRVELSFSLLEYHSDGTYYAHKNLGPYTGRWVTSKLLGYEVNLNSTNLINAPEPENDGLRGFDHLQYGFKDLRSLGNWFGGCWRSMEKCGYHIGIYECPDKYVKTGGKQIAFSLEKATLIQSVSFKEFIRNKMYFTNTLNENDEEFSLKSTVTC